jgi:hypothetical protein
MTVLRSRIQIQKIHKNNRSNFADLAPSFESDDMTKRTLVLQPNASGSLSLIGARIIAVSCINNVLDLRLEDNTNSVHTYSSTNCIILHGVLNLKSMVITNRGTFKEEVNYVVV